MECLFSFQHARVPIYTAWSREAHVCEQLVQGCIVCEAERPRREPATSRLQFRRSNRYVLSTTPPRHTIEVKPNVVAMKQVNYVYTIHKSTITGSDCTVLTATGLVNGEWQILTPYRIETPKPIDKTFGTRNYVWETTHYAKFGANRSTGGFWANR